MSDLFPLPAELKQVEYAQLFFHLEFSGHFDLPPLGLLHLRRELLQALKTVQLADSASAEQLRELLQPPDPQDPLLKKRFKTPAPGFVLAPDPARQGLLQPQEQVILPVFLLGSAVRKANHFAILLEQLGQLGIYHGTGQFRIAAIEGESAASQRSMIWQQGEPLAELSVPANDLHWWLELQPVSRSKIELEILSPMRLLHQGKPLFQAGFSDFFSFLLRRVTAMLAWHGGIEPVEDPVGLLNLAAQVETVSGRLKWTDWRRLTGDFRHQDLGGLLGKLQLAGPALVEIDWLLQLGSLFQVGKGAAFGAGRYRLRNI